MLQRQHQDALDASHFQQIEAERACTRGLQPFGGVAIGQAQQLLALAQLGPRKRSLQQPLGEAADVGPSFIAWCTTWSGARMA